MPMVPFNENTRDTATSTLSKIHTEFLGENNVYEYTSKFGSTFIAFHDDGDLSVLFRATFNGKSDSVWLDLPINSKKSVNTLIYNDIQVSGPARVENRLSYSGDYGGVVEVTVEGERVVAEKINGKLESAATYIIPGRPDAEQVFITDINMSFAPEIGFFALQETSITHQGSRVGTGSHAQLISYELK